MESRKQDLLNRFSALMVELEEWSKEYKAVSDNSANDRGLLAFIHGVTHYWGEVRDEMLEDKE